MSIKSITLLSLLAFVPGLAAQEAPRRRDADPVRPRPRSLLDPPQAQGGRMPPEMTTVPSDVRDTAGLFSADACASARESLAKIEKSTGVPVLVETIDTLQGETIDEAATRLARRSGTQGVFILIARKESKIEVLASRRYSEALPQPSKTKVRTAFTESFRKSNFNDGLLQGISAIETELVKAKQEHRVPQAEKAEGVDAGFGRLLLPREKAASPPGPSAVSEDHRPEGSAGQDKPLVIRNQVRSTLEEARTIIAAATKQAVSMNLKVNVAVVDDGGHLLSFDRMNESAAGQRLYGDHQGHDRGDVSPAFRADSRRDHQSRPALEPQPADRRTGQRREDHHAQGRHTCRGGRSGDRRRGCRRRLRRAGRPGRPRGSGRVAGCGSEGQVTDRRQARLRTIIKGNDHDFVYLFTSLAAGSGRLRSCQKGRRPRASRDLCRCRRASPALPAPGSSSSG